MSRKRKRFQPHRAARFFIIQTWALWLCLALIVLTCSGYTQGEVVVLRAMEHLGKPYVLGAVGPDQFDCSGLVMYCLEPEGFEFPYHAAAVIGTDERYPLIENPRDLLAGDVVCFDTVADKDPSDHMGFYIGGNRFIHASSTGEVKMSALEDFYLEKFTGARRYVQPYYYLPSRSQIAAWFDSTGIPRKLAPAIDWIGQRLAPAREWIGERLKPVRDWFAGLDIPGRIGAAREWVASLWNSIFGRNPDA